MSLINDILFKVKARIDLWIKHKKIEKKKYNTYTFKKDVVVWFDVTNHVILRHIKINVVKCEQERYVTSRITLKNV